MVQLLTTGEALDLFESRVTLKQMKGKTTQMVFDCLQAAQSHGSGLVLFIADPKLNRQATALLGHWVPTELSPALCKMAGLIPSTVGWTKPAEPPTRDQLVDIILEPIKQITADWYKEFKEQYPEEFAQFEKDKQQADQEINDRQDSETSNTPES